MAIVVHPEGNPEKIITGTKLTDKDQNRIV
jgi:gluconate kinase